MDLLTGIGHGYHQPILYLLPKPDEFLCIFFSILQRKEIPGILVQLIFLIPWCNNKRVWDVINCSILGTLPGEDELGVFQRILPACWNQILLHWLWGWWINQGRWHGVPSCGMSVRMFWLFTSIVEYIEW